MCRETGFVCSDFPLRIFGGAFRGFAFAARFKRVLRPRCAHFAARLMVDVEAMHRACSGIGGGTIAPPSMRPCFSATTRSDAERSHLVKYAT